MAWTPCPTRPAARKSALTGVTRDQARNTLWNAFDERYRPEMRTMERGLLLNLLDSSWKNHLLQMDVRYVQCAGVELWTDTGDRILDFLSGYCVHNAGHNHPRIVAAMAWWQASARSIAAPSPFTPMTRLCTAALWER